MPARYLPPKSATECLERSQALDRQMKRFLWIPGRRRKLAVESYDVAHACREFGNLDLAEANFRRVPQLFQDKRPTRSQESLNEFSLVAAAHNHVGLLHLDAGRPTDAIPSFDRAIEIRRELDRLSPDCRENQVYLGGALCNRAHAVAESDPASARDLYQQSLSILRHPVRRCECSYWDEQRQSWWCEQLEAMGDALKLNWVFLAPQFVDNAMQGLQSLDSPAKTGDNN